MSDLEIVHVSRGRLRLRIANGAVADGLPAAVLAEPGVSGCRWSPRTRSLVVLFRPEAADAQSLTEAVARVTGATVRPSHGELDAEPPPVEPGTALTAGLRDLVGIADRGVQRFSRGTLGLSSLLPIALVAWAAMELVRGRTGPLAWSTALWYAHGLYRDYSVSGPRD